MIKLYRYDIESLPESAADAQKMRHEVGVMLISQAAKELAGADAPTVMRTDNGKPYFKDIPLHFSVSHSEKRVILAVSDRNIGADIQFIAPRNTDIANRYFTEAECAYIGDDLARFYEIWTKKEAYGKWEGTGLSAALKVDVTNLVFYTENDGEYALAVYEK